MTFSLSLPFEILKPILLQAVEHAPSRPSSEILADDWEQWRRSLEIWRGVLSQAQGTPEAMSAILNDQSLWKAAEQCLRSTYLQSNGYEQVGDWTGHPPTPALRAELVAWQKSGLLPLQAPTSTTEWLAVALIHLATTCQHPLSEKTWGMRIQEALVRNSPALTAALLDHAPGASVDTPLAVLKARSLQDPIPYAHHLFAKANAQASAVLATRLTRSSIETRDGKARTALFCAGHDPDMAHALLRMGADPNARDASGQLPESCLQLMPRELSQAQEFHDLLGRFRTPEEQAKARSEWRAALMAWNAVGPLRESGLLAELQADPWVDTARGRLGLLRYILTHADFSLSGKQHYTLIAHLIKGRKGQNILAAEGSLLQGVAAALALATKGKEEDWSDRRTVYQESLQESLNQVLHTEEDRRRLVQATLELLPLRPADLTPWVGPESFQRLFGEVYGLLRSVAKPTAGEKLPNLDVAALRPLGEALSQAASTYSVGKKSDLTPVMKQWKTTHAVVCQLLESGPLALEDKVAWLPGVLFLAAIFPDPNPLRAKAIQWSLDGVSMAPPSKQQAGTSRLEDLVADRWPGFESLLRQRRMEASVSATSPAPRPTIRF